LDLARKQSGQAGQCVRAVVVEVADEVVVAEEVAVVGCVVVAEEWTLAVVAQAGSTP
jgi:hypothetical protein